ncbi:conserved hypothetical protein [Paenibacillus curdlanolyticus YK9]|uniref:Uncharacterized protein n=1 Tax=Paenibacillus curdlanolyticus YK9 TaxID=717606 RepID=E0IGC4_9BACL|nr:hypothetical protein [Paenibacillus curdlanolyticus]EFM08526.1 conserved hypothetical protein [Paenibacillus curdlanolyticus YK9]
MDHPQQQSAFALPFIKTALAVAIVTAMTAGCSLRLGQSEDEQVVGNDPISSNSAILSNSGPKQGQSDTLGDSLSEPSMDEKTAEATGASNAKAKTAEPKWDKEHPSLAGITIGQQQTDVKATHGDPVDAYAQDDGANRIDIIEYDGYSVGFGTGKKGVLFVEIHAKSVATGLSGLRVGDMEDKAVKALGKPDAQSAYLIAYQGKQSVLKLDIDPEKHEIVSIKLFIES